MRTQHVARTALLLTAVSLASGCAVVDVQANPASYPIGLRLVTSSAPGPCSAPPLTADVAGTACDLAGSTTYVLGPPLATLTPRSVARQSPAAGPSVVATFGPTDTTTLRDVTTGQVNKQVAVLRDGKVVAAPVIKAPITNGSVTFSFSTAAQADDAATALGATSAR
ncbi:Protein translocase subunit SecD [Cellulomonas sp. T2.31MG-18]|uniref:SecDF P1 head subdomain-containing protein n=1 Tax=Cellulomonas sp. T2.31MG-18 TaxID=3157619 RepID=UPI0035E5A0AB